MAFTLEAALTVPLCLVTTVLVVSLALPAAGSVRASAVRSADAVAAVSDNHNLYRILLVEHRESTIPAVSASPKRLIDMYQLISDLKRPVNTISGLISQESASASG